MKAHGWVGLCCVVSALLGFWGLGVFGVRGVGACWGGNERESARLYLPLKLNSIDFITFHFIN